MKKEMRTSYKVNGVTTNLKTYVESYNRSRYKHENKVCKAKSLSFACFLRLLKKAKKKKIKTLYPFFTSFLPLTVD